MKSSISRWTPEELSILPIRQIDNNRRKYVYNVGLEKNFLKNLKSIREKINGFENIKTKESCTMKVH